MTTERLPATSAATAARDDLAAWHAAMRLVAACARPTLGPDTAQGIRTLAVATRDWARVMRLARRHGVRPLLYRGLSTSCREAVPAEVLDALLAFVQADAAHNLLQNAELLQLLSGFAEAGIQAIPFKGAMLATSAYGDPSLRESGDIDIVIRTRHIRPAVAYLTAHDYRRRGESQDAPHTAELDPLGRYLRFDRIDGLASVDLQTSLEAPHFSFALDADELWDRTVSGVLGGQTVLGFCDEDLLVLLGVHGTKDMWFKLKWIVDIAGFIERHRALDWDRVLERAARLRARRRLLLGCALAHDVLGVDLPERVLGAVAREPGVRASAQAVAAALAVPDRTVTDAERFALYFRTEDSGARLRRIWRYLRRSLARVIRPSDIDRAFVRLPSALAPAYYLVRPLRLLLRFVSEPRLVAKAFRELFESLD